jgi:hypothetical protein
LLAAYKEIGVSKIRQFAFKKKLGVSAANDKHILRQPLVKISLISGQEN